MLTLIPTACGCHTLQSPPIEKDDRLNLHVRTGSALILYNSFVFTFGGLTIGLELEGDVSVDSISATFIRKITNNKLKNIGRYLSGEIFYLDLISRAWSRVAIPAGQPRPKPRLFHEIATGKGCLYVFGGLVISETTNGSGQVHGSGEDAFQLVPCNDLWEFNLLTKSWVLLHDGSGWESDPKIPCPRYSHKLATLNHLTFVNKKDHFGMMIAGGCDANSARIYKNSVYDFVDKCYVDAGPPLRYPVKRKLEKEKEDDTQPRDDQNYISINYLDSSIVSFTEEAEIAPTQAKTAPGTSKKSTQESLFVYAPAESNGEISHPIMTCKIGKQIYPPKVPPLWQTENMSTEKSLQYVKRTVPFNLRYPTGGLFGQNLVLIGFLANDYDISIFIYNKPTGKWSRLNIFCHHEYGSHRFWGGFVWSSHHKVVLLGNYVTSQTTSSVRYFSSMITVSLPVTNILASMELAGGVGRISHRTTSSDIGSSSDALSSTSEDLSETDLGRVGSFTNSEDQTPKATFNDYVHYAAPKVKFTKVRSTFPPAAITLGRNALRYGDLISDFELISSNGDRIPVCLSILMERWGKYFIDLLARAYVKAVDQFEHDEIKNNSDSKLGSLKSSRASGSVDSELDKHMQSSGSSDDRTHALNSKTLDRFQKDVPQFRLPFQDSPSPAPEDRNSMVPPETSVDPCKQIDRRNSQVSSISGTSVLKYHLKEIPSQLPLPKEPIPDISSAPTTFRSSSRKNSSDFPSPRGSLLHTLTALRNIPSSKSSKETSRESPFSTPPASGSGSHEYLIDEVIVKANEVESQREEAKGSVTELASTGTADSHLPSLQSSRKNRSLLDFQNIDVDNFRMEPSLIPRKLYIPFESSSLKAFAEYLYTGQIGNKWALHPCTLDCLLISRYFRVPLLYDLICEVLYGVIGRKEALVLEEGKVYKRKFKKLFERLGISTPENFHFPLEEFTDFLDSVDDGYMDIALLRKSSNVHKLSTSSGGSKRKSSVRTADINLSPISEPENAETAEVSGKTLKKGPQVEDSTSASDEDSSGLHYLDYMRTGSMPGIRYKSVFDKTVYDTVNPANLHDNEFPTEAENLAALTLEMLVSPDYPAPSNYVIDLILDMASVCTDVKLMLRSMNARQMGLSLEQTKKDYADFYEKHKAELDKEENVEQYQAPTEDKPELPTKKSSTMSVATLKSGPLSMTLLKEDEEKARSEKVKVKPFKEQRAESLMLNRKLDKHIAQMIKKDERMKMKAVKEEKEKVRVSRKDKSEVMPKYSREGSLDSISVLTAHPEGEAHKTSRLKKLGQKLKHKKKEPTLTPLHRLNTQTSLESSLSKKSAGSRVSEATMRSFFGKLHK